MKWQRTVFLLLAAAAFWWSAGGRSVSASASAEILEEGPKYVALTFDDGPRADTTGRLLDGLKERGVSATFFLIGRQIEKNRDLVLRMKAEGHQVGNHTYDHMGLQSLDAAAVMEEIEKTDSILQELLGPGTYWVRPPFGRVTEAERKLICVPMVSWSVDPEDWKVRNADKVVSAVLSHVGPNDIILMHDFYSTSVDAALRIVDALEAKGYQFVTVEELLALNGIDPEPVALYRSGKIK